MKMRVLISGKGKMNKLGEILATKHGCKIDVVPPAYSCDKERLVLLGVSLADDLDNALSLFAKDMSKQKAQNVALFIEGKQKGADKLIAALKEAGTNVIEEVYWVKGGSILSMFKGISAEDKEAIIAWSERAIANLA